MRKIILCASIIFTGVYANAETLQNVYARDTMSLNGTWQIIVDPLDNGFYDYRMAESPKGFFKNEKPTNGYEHVEYDFVDNDALLVPGDWNTQRDQLFFYEGSVWYMRDFDYSLPPDRKLYAYFAAANYSSDVYLNGVKLGTHEGGFTPFFFDITDKVQPTGNYLIVRVNNQRHKGGVPTVNTDWWNYGGLTRDVMLVETPAVFVDDYSIKLPKGKYDQIELSATLNTALPGREITVQIPELAINSTLTTDGLGNVNQTIKAKPELWSPTSPKLYDIAIISNNDTIKDQIGFRHIETRGREVLLNGEPIFLRGISVHEEAPFRTGRCTTETDDSVLIYWAKELGCNFLRLAHYPHNEQMVRRSEREGFLLWSEIPVYWTIDWENTSTLDNARNQLRENMMRDHNRCAIIVWSIANETPQSEARNFFLTTLAKDVRDRDDERLISMAMEGYTSEDGVHHINDTMQEYVDIISFNNYLGWYGGKPIDCDARTFDIPYQKPVFVSEFGAGALAGLHGEIDQKWTEEYQADLYRHTIDMYDRMEGFAGCSPWILMDFRSTRRQNHQTQNFFNRKGLLSENGQKKAAFDVLRDFYLSKKR